MIALGLKAPVLLGAAVIGLAGFAHGFAHGMEVQGALVPFAGDLPWPRRFCMRAVLASASRWNGSRNPCGCASRASALRPPASLWLSREAIMIPGEVITKDGDIEMNVGRVTLRLTVANTGQRPIQIGSHYHFFETNGALSFDREKARGFRLDIPAGTAVRFEPGQTREVALVEIAGKREVYGFRGLVMGKV